MLLGLPYGGHFLIFQKIFGIIYLENKGNIKHFPDFHNIKIQNKGDKRMNYSRRDEDMFRYFISGMDQKMQAQLNLMFAHNKIMAGEEHRREMEQMKREITD